MDTIKYRYNLLKNAIITGDFSNVIKETKIHLISNKNTYIILTFLVILYVLYERDIYTLLCMIRKNTPIKLSGMQLGGETVTANTPEIQNAKKLANEPVAEPTNKSANTASSTPGKASQMAQGASGLCDGNGLIAKMCRGGKDGVYNYFKFFGFVILVGLAVLSPFVIYIVLVYMMLKIMFTGLKNV